MFFALAGGVTISHSRAVGCELLQAQHVLNLFEGLGQSREVMHSIQQSLNEIDKKSQNCTELGSQPCMEYLELLQAWFKKMNEKTQYYVKDEEVFTLRRALGSLETLILKSKVANLEAQNKQFQEQLDKKNK